MWIVLRCQSFVTSHRLQLSPVQIVLNNFNSYITNQTKMLNFSDGPQFLTQLISRIRAAYPSHHSSNVTRRSAGCKAAIHFSHANSTAFRPHIFPHSSLSNFRRCCPLEFRRLSTLILLSQRPLHVTAPSTRTAEICCYTTEYFMQSVVNFRHFIIL